MYARKAKKTWIMNNIFTTFGIQSKPKHMRKITFTFLLATFLIHSYAQVGINILIPDSSAVLQLESNKKGLGLSRLTTPEMNAVWNPLNGLTVFNTTDSVIEYWNGQCWLKVYERNCYECDFNMSLSHNTDTIDRTFLDSAFTTLTVQQTHGAQIIDVSWMATPPSGVQVYTQGNTSISNSGSVDIVVKADVFADGGNVPIILLAVCGDKIHILTYNVYIKPCVKVNIPMDYMNYDLQAVNSSLLPAGVRECVLVNVYPNVEVTSSLPTSPSYTSGNLHPLSIVGIINNGYFLGRGGDGGGFVGNVVGGVAGANGGDAMSLTTRTVINNYGGIYGGGGGGASIGLSTSFSIIGINITLGFGLGGGGGSELGIGGAPPSGNVVLGGYAAGADATAGHNSVAGAGGAFSAPISITYSGIGIQVTPTGSGGDGGAYGQPGTQGSLGVCIGLVVPLLGNVNLGCFNQNVFANGGLPGLAIKRNSNPLQNINDGAYNNNQVKGQVAP